jgi:prophage regulatory protein
MTKTNKITAAPRLPQYVGYREVQDAVGLSRRTIERMVRDGKFPRPAQLAPNRVGWQMDVVLAWLDQRGAGPLAKAVEKPGDLLPDQLEAHGQEWLRRTVSKFAGERVDLRHVHIGYHPPLTEAKDDALFSAQVDALEDKFADLDETDSAIVVAWLFPAMRSWFNWPDAATQRSMNDPVELRNLALRALDGDE